MAPPYLVPLAAPVFDGIPEKAVPRTIRLADPALESAQAVEWILDGYCEKLLVRNSGLQELFQRFAGRLDAPECCTCLTEGQRTLHALAAFDGQVNNGGLAQFFWNCPDLVLEVSEALRVLGLSELLGLYERALAGLTGKQDDWVKLRQRAAADPAEFWGPFEQSYRLLDLGWFDDVYFAEHGPELRKRLADYVKGHKEEFIST